MTEKKTGILFDLDGTLWDPSSAAAASWNIVLDRYEDAVRKATPEWMHRLMGKTMTEIEKIFLDYLPPVRRHELMNECFEYENTYIAEHGGTLFDGVKKTLEVLHADYHLSVVSNCQEGYIPSFFKAHGMNHYFDDYEENGRTGKNKAGNIRLVIERNRLEHAVYVGDTMGDYNSAMEAGIPFIHASYGFGEVPEGIPKVMDISQVPQIMETMIWLP